LRIQKLVPAPGFEPGTN